MASDNSQVNGINVTPPKSDGSRKANGCWELVVEGVGSVKVAERGGLQAWWETVEQCFKCRGGRG
nr:hypothetical protein [Tanacetum cinerariifolium]